MRFFENFKKRLAIKGYYKKLAGFLAKEYGRANYYKPGQITKTIEKNNLNERYQVYAIAMYSELNNYNSYCSKNDISVDYDELRKEVADCHFDGNANFNASDVVPITYIDDKNIDITTSEHADASAEE